MPITAKQQAALYYARKRRRAKASPPITGAQVAALLSFGVDISVILQHQALGVEALAASIGLGANIVAVLAHAPPVTPGSQDFDTGSGNFDVPNYNTLEIELWGGGASGSGTGNDGKIAGNAGGTTTVTSLSLSAPGGLGPIFQFSGNSAQAGGLGQTPTGGDINTPGNPGGGVPVNLSPNGGGGGSAPNGGAGGAQTSAGGVNTATPGNQGSAPGGGSSGCTKNTASPGIRSTAGGASGSYLKKTYVLGVTGGAPTPGDILAWVVGSGGALSIGAAPINAASPAGRNGRVRFTWS